MNAMEMEMFDAMECVVDALADGIPLKDPKFAEAAKSHAQDKSDYPTIDRIVEALRKEFCKC